MAYRRSIIARTKLFYQQHRDLPLHFHIYISGSDREELPAKRNSEIRSHFPITRNIAGNSLLSGNASRLMRSEVPAGYGLIFHRNLSKVPWDSEVLPDAEEFNGLIGGVGDKVVEAAPVVNEVAVATADSFEFQNLIDFVHCYTGLEWWAAIAVTTLLFRCIHIPFRIYLLKFWTKNYTTFIQPQFSEYYQARRNKDTEKVRAILGKARTKYGEYQFIGLVSSYTHGIFLFLCISDMVGKVPSFTTGGTLWFTDLTAPNCMYLPVLMALTLWIKLDLDPIHRLEGVPPRKLANKIFAVVAYLGAVTAGFPTAMYYSWITSNLFSIAYATVMMEPQVQKLLGISLRPRSTNK